MATIYSFFKKWKDVFLVASELHTSFNCAHKSKTTKYKDGSKNHTTVQINTHSEPPAPSKPQYRETLWVCVPAP